MKEQIKRRTCKLCGVTHEQYEMCLTLNEYGNVSFDSDNWYCESCYAKIKIESKKIQGIRPSKIVAFADVGNKILLADENKVIWEVKRNELIVSDIKDGSEHGDIIKVKSPKLNVKEIEK